MDKIKGLLNLKNGLFTFADDDDDDKGGGGNNFDQASFDRGIKKGLAKAKTQSDKEIKKLMSQIETLKEKTNLTKEERDELEGELQELRKKVMTEEEIADKIRSEEAKKYKKEISDLTKKLETTDTLLRDTVAKNEVLTAATKGRAVKPEQIQALVKDKIGFEAVLDDDKNLVGYKVQMKMNVPPKNGKGDPEEQILSVADGVKLFLEDEDNKHLVMASGRSGGGSGEGSLDQVINAGGRGDLGSVTDMENWEKNKDGLIQAALDGKLSND